MSVESLNLLSKEQIKYLVGQFVDSLQDTISKKVASTINPIDDVVWALAHRTILSDEMVQKAVDILLDKVGIK